MIPKILAAGAALVLAAAPAAFAQEGATGSGNPSTTPGAPPNASIAPDMVPAGANMGTKASSMTNQPVPSGGEATHNKMLVRKKNGVMQTTGEAGTPTQGSMAAPGTAAGAETPTLPPSTPTTPQ